MNLKSELQSLIQREAILHKETQWNPNFSTSPEGFCALDQWINDVDIFCQRYLKDYPLYQRIQTIIFHRDNNTIMSLVACLNSILNDKVFLGDNDVVNSSKTQTAKTYPQYDVFISHASKDKLDYVEQLKNALDKLNIKIFYDKDSIKWGDKWKQRILEGVASSEFAIIVISENFFGREWTEKELDELLNRENDSGQKIILPLLHKITVKQLEDKYPDVADIQAISSSDYNFDDITYLFAEQLIKRLKEQRA